MGKIDDGFEHALELEPGEVLRWNAGAIHRVGRTWVGGRIYVSDKRFFFCPGVLSRGRYDIVRLPLSSIVRVEQSGWDRAASTGGFRRRVVIKTKLGDERVFRLPRFAKHARELRAVLGDRP